jgi:hypothetical protein
MKLETYISEVMKQIREGASAAHCGACNPVEMDVWTTPDGNVGSSENKSCARVHIIVAMLPNDPKLSHGHEPDSRKDGGVQ